MVPRKPLNLTTRLIGCATLALIALMPLPLYAEKAYEGVYIKVTGTWTNKNNVRLIEGQTMQQSGTGLAFILSCNPKYAHCTAPKVSTAYSLYAPSKEFYYEACDNYLLGSSAIESGGIPVCLESVEPTP